VSSSLPENPLERKQAAVDAGLAASDLNPGDCAGEPLQAIEAVGDPVLAATLGLTEGITGSGGEAVLAGGTQQLAACALLRHAGVEEPLTVATTSYVAEDDSASVRALAESLDVELAVTDPGFAGEEHPTARRFEAGEAKEGVGMGGALRLADAADRLPAVRHCVQRGYERLVDHPAAQHQQ
jgi:NaMN:DMB phosphoribosyltransferase